MLLYKIYSNGKLIAAFLTESDRDWCLDAFAAMYDDCTFEAGDDL